MATISAVRDRSGANAICDSADAANTENGTTPASRWDATWNVPASTLGASEVNSPKTAKPANAATAAAENAPPEAAGSEMRCGRYAGRSSARSTVSGTSATASAARARITRNTA